MWERKRCSAGYFVTECSSQHWASALLCERPSECLLETLYKQGLLSAIPTPSTVSQLRKRVRHHSCWDTGNRLIFWWRAHKYHHMYIHVHIYTHIHIYTRTHTHICTYIHTCICIHTYMHIYTQVHIHICAHIYTHAYMYIYTHIHIYAHIYTHVYVYTHICTYIYTYTHKHTHTYIYLHMNTHQQKQFLEQILKCCRV